jgi:hypothetical protein
MSLIPLFDKDSNTATGSDGTYTVYTARASVYPCYNISTSGYINGGGLGSIFDGNDTTGVDFESYSVTSTTGFPYRIILTLPVNKTYTGPLSMNLVSPWVGCMPKTARLNTYTGSYSDSTFTPLTGINYTQTVDLGQIGDANNGPTTHSWNLSLTTPFNTIVIEIVSGWGSSGRSGSNSVWITSINFDQASSFSYTPMPSGPRTLLNYITSFGINGNSYNNGSAIWNSGRASLPLTHHIKATNYFTRYDRVNIMQGDGTIDELDWSIFNFDRDANGDYDGYSTTLAYFAGESTASGGTGGLGSGYYGIIWGWNSGWNKLFQLDLPGNGAYNHSYAPWWTSGTTVTSGNGKYSAYDNTLITYIGFSFQKNTDGIPSLMLQSNSTLTATKNTILSKYILNASLFFDFFSTNNTETYTRNYSSNATGIVTVPNTSIASATIAGPGTTTINVTQSQTSSFTAVTQNSIITIIIVGNGATYSSIDMSELDLSGVNLSSSVFTNCSLNNAIMTDVTMNNATNFSSSSLRGVKSGRITGITTLLPSEFKVI